MTFQSVDVMMHLKNGWFGTHSNEKSRKHQGSHKKMTRLKLVRGTEASI